MLLFNQDCFFGGQQRSFEIRFFLQTRTDCTCARQLPEPNDIVSVRGDVHWVRNSIFDVAVENFTFFFRPSPVFRIRRSRLQAVEHTAENI